jgi:hypothetical protein
VRCSASVRARFLAVRADAPASISAARQQDSFPVLVPGYPTSFHYGDQQGGAGRLDREDEADLAVTRRAGPQLQQAFGQWLAAQFPLDLGRDVPEPGYRLGARLRVSRTGVGQFLVHLKLGPGRGVGRLQDIFPGPEGIGPGLQTLQARPHPGLGLGVPGDKLPGQVGLSLDRGQFQDSLLSIAGPVLFQRAATPVSQPVLRPL